MNDKKDTIEDLFNRLGEQEKQNVINYAYLYDDIRGLISEIRQLQSNWNSLRKLLINEKKLIEEDEFFCNLSNKDYIEFILDKMNELEGKNK